MKAWIIRISSLVIAVNVMGAAGSGFQNPKSSGGERNCCDELKATGGDVVVAVINGSRLIREKEIDEIIGSQLYGLQEKIYTLRKKALDNLIAQILIKEEAASRGITEGELRNQLVPSRVDIKQADIDKSYADNLSALEFMDEDEARQRIKLDLEGRLKLDRYKSAVSELIGKARVEFYLSRPMQPVARIKADGPLLGSQQAPVTVVEFSDFQCPYCKQASGVVKRVVESYGASVRLIFKQMPLSIHPDAFKAAQASVCANEQGRFWEFHDLLFSANDLSTDSLKRLAVTSGLNTTQFDACMNSENSSSLVRKDIQEAIRADVQGTPTFFVNGRILRGMKTADDLKNLIDAALRQN